MIDVNNLKFEEKTLKDENGLPLIRLLVPEGWRVETKMQRGFYRGYKYPYYFTVSLWSPDNTCRIRWFSPCHLYKNILNPMQENTIDSYGNLQGEPKDLETRLINRAESYFKDIGEVTDLKRIELIYYKNNNETGSKKYEQRIKEYEKDKLHVVSDFYYKGGNIKYSFRRKNHDRFYCTSSVMESTTYESWAYLPYSIVQGFNDPFMNSMLKQGFPYAQYNEVVNAWIYLPLYYTSTLVHGIMDMDCLFKDKDFLYKNVYVKIINHGIYITDELWADFRRVQNEKEKVREANRQARKQKNEEERKERERINQRKKETWDYVRKTQEDIAKIRKETWENTNRTQDKVREMWGDTLRGDTRFVDKYGDEHVIHTYDKYAYKSGDTYVTSDSPLDHGWDWEELEKKKY